MFLVNIFTIILVFRPITGGKVVPDAVKDDILKTSSYAESWKKYMDVFYPTGIQSDESQALSSSSYGLASDNKRIKLFIKRKKIIEDHNKRYEQGLTRSLLEVNKFMILFEDEFQQYLGYIPSNDSSSDSLESRHKEWAPREDLPEVVDYVKDGYITPIKEQGECGSSYTFAAVAVIEYGLAKATGRLLSLSEQELINCYFRTTTSYTPGMACSGGVTSHIASFVMRQERLTTSRHKPYLAKEEEHCNSEDYPNALKGWVVVNSKPILDKGRGFTGRDPIRSDSMLADHIERFGPFFVGVRAKNTDLYAYKEGIMDELVLPHLLPDHAVAFVGYTKECFLMKNSWGTDWGEKGYGRLARRQNTLSMFSQEAGTLTFQKLNGENRDPFWDDENWWKEYYEEEKKAGREEEFEYERQRLKYKEGWWRKQLDPTNNELEKDDESGNLDKLTIQKTVDAEGEASAGVFSKLFDKAFHEKSIALGTIAVAAIIAALIQGSNCLWISRSAQRGSVSQWESDEWIVFIINIFATGALTVNVILIALFIKDSN